MAALIGLVVGGSLGWMADGRGGVAFGGFVGFVIASSSPSGVSA